MNDVEKWYLRTQDETFGPVTEEKLVSWAERGRIQPGQEVSDDNITWIKVEEVDFLDMRFSIDIGDGNPRGPFNRKAAEALLASGRLPKTTTIVETRPPFEKPVEVAPAIATPPPPPPSEVVPPKTEPSATPAPQVVEKIVEVPVDRIVEKVVEVPVERVIEVPVEKIVVDETKVKSLEEKNSELEGEVARLTEELKSLPTAAGEVAQIQAAVFGLMSEENEELVQLIEVEKREFEEVKRRHLERIDRLMERRRTLLKKSGSDIEDMTRRALQIRPEDPRTVQLRKEYEDLKRTQERNELDMRVKIRELEEELRVRRTEEARMSESMKDITQLRQECETLRAKLQRTEQDLMVEREKSEKMRQSAAIRQQTMLARLASLESPSIGTTDSMATNQSREAKLVKLPSWMKIHK